MIVDHSVDDSTCNRAENSRSDIDTRSSVMAVAAVVTMRAMVRINRSNYRAELVGIIVNIGGQRAGLGDQPANLMTHASSVSQVLNTSQRIADAAGGSFKCYRAGSLISGKQVVGVNVVAAHFGKQRSSVGAAAVTAGFHGVKIGHLVTILVEGEDVLAKSVGTIVVAVLMIALGLRVSRCEAQTEDGAGCQKF